MQKVVFILPNLNAGGAEKVFLNIINLLKNEIKIYLIVFDSSGLLKGTIPKEVIIIDLKTKRLRNSLLRLLYHIFKIKPHVIFSTLLHVNIYLLIINLLSLNSYNIILRETNFPFQNMKKNFILFFVYKYLYKSPKKIITSSLLMKDEFIKKFNLNTNKIIHINNPVIFYHQNEKKKLLDNFDKQKINFLSIGRLTSQKNYNFLINTYKKIKNLNFHANIYGEGIDYYDLISKIKDFKLENKVFIRKNVLNVKEIYQNSDVLIVTSRWEGMSNVILEALFCGLTIICSNSSGAINELSLNFENQIIIYKNQEDLIKILSKIIKNNVVKKTIVKMPKNYSNFEIKDKYLKLLKDYL